MMMNKLGRNRLLGNQKGSALIEFALMLPILLLVLVVMVDLCLLLDEQISLIHLSREAGGALSRGAEFHETFNAITMADGHLNLDTADGQVILTRVAYDENGVPAIIAQESIGSLGRASSVGNALADPAQMPNGRTLPSNVPLVIVEVFSRQQHFLASLLGGIGFGAGQGQLILNSRAAF